MKKLFLFTALVVAAAFSACSKHDNEINDVEPPETTPLAIAFAEGNSLQFDVDETKIVHYTITSGGANNVVKAELQTPDDAYTVETTPTSATEGTIKITAKVPTDNRVIVTVSDGDRSISAEITVSAKPDFQELAITFAEGNSLQFDVNETKTVHYTITGSSGNTVVVKAELQNPDNAYTLETTPTSATEGTITITAKMPETDNCVIVTVSDGSQIITATIDVTLKASFDGKTVVVAIPGTLAALLADYDTTEITELTVIGNLNDEDIKTLKNLPNLTILDMENAKLEALPAEAFYKNQSLTSIKLPKTLKTIGDDAFSCCSSLTTVTIGNNVTTIGENAFYGCYSLTSITIGNNVTTIGEYAFLYCTSLTSVTIPDSVTTIGKGAFTLCPMTSITIPDSVTTIGDSAFNNCHSLTSVTIGNGVKSIGISAFLHCRSLTSITIPNSVTMIGSGAFEGCSNLSAFYGKLASSDNRCLIVDGCLTAFAPAGLTFYTIPNSITSIGICAFSQCSGLTRITIGNNVKSIGNGAFYLCSNLIYINCRAQTPPSVGINAFSNVNASATLYVPTGSKAAYAAAYGWNEFKTIIETQF